MSTAIGTPSRKLKWLKKMDAKVSKSALPEPDTSSKRPAKQADESQKSEKP